MLSISTVGQTYRTTARRPHATAMEELTERPALPASAEDEAAGWDWNETNIDEFEED